MFRKKPYYFGIACVQEGVFVCVCVCVCVWLCVCRNFMSKRVSVLYFSLFQFLGMCLFKRPVRSSVRNG